jgi:hypothetical protein
VVPDEQEEDSDEDVNTLSDDFDGAEINTLDDEDDADGVEMHANPIHGEAQIVLAEEARDALAGDYETNSDGDVVLDTCNDAAR